MGGAGPHRGSHGASASGGSLDPEWRVLMLVLVIPHCQGQGHDAVPVDVAGGGRWDAWLLLRLLLLDWGLGSLLPFVLRWCRRLLLLPLLLLLWLLLLWLLLLWLLVLLLLLLWLLLLWLLLLWLLLLLLWLLLPLLL